MNGFQLAREQLLWRTGLKMYQGVTHRELIDSIDLQISQLLGDEISGESAVSLARKPNSGFAMHLCDGILATYTSNFAEAGDFASANTFLASITAGVSQEHTFEVCLGKAEALSQVAIIKPNEMTVALSSDIALQFSFTGGKTHR